MTHRGFRKPIYRTMESLNFYLVHTLTLQMYSFDVKKKLALMTKLLFSAVHWGAHQQLTGTGNVLDFFASFVFDTAMFKIVYTFHYNITLIGEFYLISCGVRRHSIIVIYYLFYRVICQKIKAISRDSGGNLVNGWICWVSSNVIWCNPSKANTLSQM